MTLTAETRLVTGGPARDLTGLVHRVRVPASPPSRRTVVMLHGRSGDEDVMWVFARTIPADWLVLAPRAIRPDPDGGYAWHPRKRDEWPTLEMFDEAVAAIVQFIRALPELYGADLHRVYLMGFSQGAAASYAAAIRHPGLIRGIAGLVGFMPALGGDAMRVAPLAGLPVFMAAGARDPTISLDVSEACARILREAGAALEYEVHATGHKLDAKGMHALTQWWRRRRSD